MLTEFNNEPVLDFSQDSIRRKQAEALERVQGQLGREHELIIGAERLRSGKTFRSINPSKKPEVVGIFQSATVEQTVHAIDVAAQTFEKWRWTPARERA